MKKTILSILLSLFAILSLQSQEVVTHSVRTPMLRRNVKMAITGKVYYVAKSGDDANVGTKESPFLTIQRFADIAQPGDIVMVREGDYHETVVPKNGGRLGEPILYVAYPDERVCIAGTEVITGKWKRHEGDIYKIKIDANVEQLFADREMMIEARWPNMPFDQLWDRDCWAEAGKGSGYMKMVDPEVAKTNVDWTGAVATLNIANQFYTWTRVVTKHEAGSDTFEYGGDMGSLSGAIGIPSRWEDDYYYLTGKLGALDIPTEWFYDKEAKMLYLWAPNGANPNDMKIEYKVRENGFRVKNLDEIHLIGFDMFACNFTFDNTKHSVVDGCHLLYPTFVRELSDSATGDPITGMRGTHNVIQNSSLAYTPISGLVMVGGYNTVRNNLVHDVCWNGSLRYPVINMMCDDEDLKNDVWNPSIVSHNTVYNAGSAGIGFRHQCYILEYNYVHHCGMMSHDVSVIYTSGPESVGSIVRYNWVHNCHPDIDRGKKGGIGIRSDDQCRNITFHHNVIWNTGFDAMVVKGEYNKVYNNTVFHTEDRFRVGNNIRMDTEPEPFKAWRIFSPLLEEQNAHSLVFNNLVASIGAKFRSSEPFDNKSNVFNNLLTAEPPLQNLLEFDFRPQEGSPLVDGGRAMPALTDDYKGDAPDIGAYEFGGIFWKPGYKATKALFYQQNRAIDKLTD